MAKLDDKVTHDKEVKYLNKLLHEAKDSNLENELNLTRFENNYGKSLLELEKLNVLIENEKFELDSVTQKNSDQQKEIDKLLNEIKNYDVLQKQKDRKISIINRKIEEVNKF